MVGLMTAEERALIAQLGEMKKADAAELQREARSKARANEIIAGTTRRRLMCTVSPHALRAGLWAKG